jgi:hypothetical protein
MDCGHGPQSIFTLMLEAKIVLILELSHQRNLRNHLLFLEWLQSIIDLSIVENEINKRKREILPAGTYVPTSLLIETIVLIKSR